MKRVINIVFIIAVITITGIDIYGIWKYKFSGGKYVMASSDSIENAVIELQPDPNRFDDSEIEYQLLDRSDFLNNERFFIINIEPNRDYSMFRLDGLIYEEYTISNEEYNSLKNGNSEIEIFGISYYKDKMKSANLILASDSAESESLYIKYDSKKRAYVVKDVITDYSLYKSTGKYVTTYVSAGTEFVIQKNNKTEKKVIDDVFDDHEKIKPVHNKIKTNFSTIQFSRSGDIEKITELVF